MHYLIAIFYFFYFAIIGVHIIFVPKVLAMLGYSPVEIGTIFAAAPLVRFIIPFAFLRGLNLNKTTFNIALLVMIVSALSFWPFLEHFTPLLIANIGLGIGLSLVLPYIEVIALHEIGKEGYGKVRLFGSIGFILVALVLVKTLVGPYSAVYYLIGVTLVTTIFAYIIAKNDHQNNVQVPQTSQEVKLNILPHYTLWLGLLFMQVSFGAFYNFFTIYETQHGISLDVTIYLWSFGVIIEIIMFYFQGPLLRKNLLLLLQIASFITIFRWLLIDIFPENLPLLFVAQSLHAFSFALFHSAAIALLFTLYEQKRLAQQFFSGITYGLGGFAGALISGYVYEWWPNELFLSAALFATLSFVFLVKSKHIAIHKGTSKNPSHLQR